MNRDILQKCPLFGGLSAEQEDYALSFFQARKKSYSRGETIHRAGERLSFFGLVLEGTVQVYMDDIGGGHMIMANVTAGDTFGESLCFLGVEDVPVYICCTSETAEVLWMSLASLSGGDERGLGLTRRFISLLAGRTLSMNDRIQILSKKSLRSKLTAYFTECAHKYCSQSFTVPFGREDMAAYLGTDRSALSRELSKMRSEGIIDFNKNKFKILTHF